ncbi:MAG: FAD-binding protein [Desulfobacterales bacterium]
MAETIETDVLVIGGGGAGFRAAIGAREKEVSVVVLSKGPLGRCGATPMAGADFTLDGKSLSSMDGIAGDPNDTKEKVFNDIITQGCFLNNQKLVEQYVRVAPQCLRELIEWGIEIKASDERMIFTSGTGIMDVLLKKAGSSGIKMLEEIAALELITKKGKIAGVLGLDLRYGKFIHFKCKAVIIATGGWHKAFWPNTGMRDLSGEGIAMAQRAGAAIGNMEFITFCCNVFYAPLIWKGSIAPYMLSLICGGRLENIRREDIFEGYDSYIIEKGTTTEWNKCFVSYVTTKEVREGKGLQNGGVHYSRGEVPWENIELVASILFPKWKYKAIDLSSWGHMLKNNEPAEVGPAVEYFDGGIVVNENFETEIPGLFAAGECTLGAFGASRVFSAITEMLVHGADAGKNAGNYAAHNNSIQLKKVDFDRFEETSDSALLRKKGIKPALLRRSVQEMAHKYLGPIRSHSELTSLLSFLEKVRKEKLPFLATDSKSRIYNKEWMDSMELPNMVQLLEASALSALKRTESRGVHFREDYPETDDQNWLRENIVRLAGEGMNLTGRQLTITSMTPPSGKKPWIDHIRQMMKSHSDTGGKH